MADEIKNQDLHLAIQKAAGLGESGWSVWGAFGYGLDFKNLLAGKTLEQIAQEKALVLKRTPFMLDVMGCAIATGQYPVRGIDIALHRDRRIRSTPEFPNSREQVLGNVLQEKTWKKITTKMEKMGIIDGFDLIVSRPEGGLNYITEDWKTHLWLLDQIYSRLSSKDGIMLVQLHGKTALDLAQILREAVLGANGSLEVDVSLGGVDRQPYTMLNEPKHPLFFRLDKKSGAPKNLPTIAEAELAPRFQIRKNFADPALEPRLKELEIKFRPYYQQRTVESLLLCYQVLNAKL